MSRPDLDPAAFVEQLAWIRRVALRLSASADDLVQDAAVARLTHAPNTDVPERAWLTRVLINFHRRGFRNLTRRARSEGVADLRETSTPESDVARHECARELLKLIFALPQAQRDVILLRYFEELSSADIAMRLAIPAGTVRWHLHEAHASLRAQMDRRPGGRDAWLGALLPAAKWTPAQLTAVLACSLVCVTITVGASAAHVARASESSARSAPRSAERAATLAERSPMPVARAMPSAAAAPKTSPASDSLSPEDADELRRVESEMKKMEDEMKESEDESALLTEVYALSGDIKQCIVSRGGDASAHSRFWIELHILANDDGKVDSARITPTPENIDIGPDIHDPIAEDCTLDVVRAHAFRAPPHDVLASFSQEQNPPPPEHVNPGTIKYDEYLADLSYEVEDAIAECAERVGDIVPTSGGVARLELDSAGIVTTAWLTPAAGEQSFPDIESCLAQPGLLENVLVDTSELVVPFAAPRQPEPFSN